MEEVLLNRQLWHQLNEDAQQESRTVNELVHEAVEQYLQARQHTKLDQEIAAYRQMHAELQTDYLGQWVAIHQQKLVAHDLDRAALYHRVRATYGTSPVLIRQVTLQPDNEIWMRTPSYG